MRFEWDEDKARRNFGKHAVEFEEAATVFADPLFLVFADDEHSAIELRYVIMARSRTGRLLVVAYTPRNDVIRIISAREATRGERERYEEEA
jgi:uncharacterized DUF497 family protein